MGCQHCSQQVHKANPLHVGRASALKEVNPSNKAFQPWSKSSVMLHTSKLVLHEYKLYVQVLCT